MAENKPQNIPAKEPRKLSFALKYLFGFGDFGFVLMSNIETFYFMSFLTAMFTPIISGVINSVFSIVDACLSWIYGGVLNSIKSQKWGRYRSWLILTPWIVPFLFACQFIKFSDNDVLSATIIVIAAIVSHIVWNIGYVANGTLVSVVGKTPEQRATLASSRATWNSLGSIAFSYLGLPFATLLAGFVGESNKWAAAAFSLGILMAVGYYSHFVMTKGYEEIEDTKSSKPSKNKTSMKEMFVSLFHNPQLMVLIIADLAKWCVRFVSAASAIYYFRDAAGNPGLMVSYTLAIGVAGVIGAFCARFISKALSTRTAMILANIGMAVFLVSIYFAYTNSTVVIALIALAYIFYGIALASAPALYADTVVYATWKTGKNASGWIMGLQNLPLKVAIFLRGVIIAACLTSVGWVSGTALDEAGKQGMTLAFALIPGIFCVVGALLLIFGFKLTKEKVQKYQAEIDARNS